jgi:hypothetical protein
MRMRAYRPEVPGCLEGRSLLSGLAGPSADPVVFSRHRLSFIVQHMQQGFDLYARYRDVAQIRSEVDDVVVMLPFGRADGVRGSIDRIITTMQREISAHVPHAFHRARVDVTATIRRDVEARVRAGDLVVR